jgi:tRNA threonylcarbamoyl adenosine modification protein YjeE
LGLGGTSVRLDEESLVRWGARIGETVTAPVLLALVGPLGAGKSVLARAVGEGAGVRQPMPSPSFNLLFRYSAFDGLEVVHLDLYRLERPDELWELSTPPGEPHLRDVQVKRVGDPPELAGFPMTVTD